MPIAFVATHLLAMCKGPLSVPVVFGSLSTRGLLDQFDHNVEDGSINTMMTSMRRRVCLLTLPTAAMPTLVEGSTVTVDGSSYVVRDQLLTDDGAVTQYHIVPSSP